MGLEENLRIVDAQAEAFNARDLGRCLDYYAESIVRHGPGLTEPIKGRAALRDLVETFLTAFPDIHAEKMRTFGQGDWVCRENLVAGTHKGPLLGPGGETVPATNKPIRIPICHVYRLESGRIVEDHQYMDMSSLMTQLGLAP